MGRKGPYWTDERVAGLVRVLHKLSRPAADAPPGHRVIQTSEALPRVVRETYMAGRDFSDEVSHSTVGDMITALKALGLLRDTPRIPRQSGFMVLIDTSMEVTGEQVRTAIVKLRG